MDVRKNFTALALAVGSALSTGSAIAQTDCGDATHPNATTVTPLNNGGKIRDFQWSPVKWTVEANDGTLSGVMKRQADGAVFVVVGKADQSAPFSVSNFVAEFPHGTGTTKFEGKTSDPSHATESGVPTGKPVDVLALREYLAAMKAKLSEAKSNLDEACLAQGGPSNDPGQAPLPPAAQPSFSPPARSTGHGGQHIAAFEGASPDMIRALTSTVATVPNLPGAFLSFVYGDPNNPAAVQLTAPGMREGHLQGAPLAVGPKGVADPRRLEGVAPDVQAFVDEYTARKQLMPIIPVNNDPSGLPLTTGLVVFDAHTVSVADGAFRVNIKNFKGTKTETAPTGERYQREGGIDITNLGNLNRTELRFDHGGWKITDFSITQGGATKETRFDQKQGATSVLTYIQLNDGSRTNETFTAYKGFIEPATQTAVSVALDAMKTATTVAQQMTGHTSSVGLIGFDELQKLQSTSSPQAPQTQPTPGRQPGVALPR